MKKPGKTTTPARAIVLGAETAADLMTANPVSIPEGATIREAIALLTDRCFSAASVIDAAGRPVGVISRADILAHDAEQLTHRAAPAEYDSSHRLTAPSGEALRSGFQVERVDRTQVREIMTPVVLSVAPETPAATVVAQLGTLKIHRLFVVDHGGVLVGVISTLDVLRHLREEPVPALRTPSRATVPL
jgi:CBS-domain-containing membrane protein